jgi:hypothetical protein
VEYVPSGLPNQPDTSISELRWHAVEHRLRLAGECERLRRELYECFKAAGADISLISDYAEPWQHLQPGEAAEAVWELRKDYMEDPSI